MCINISFFFALDNLIDFPLPILVHPFANACNDAIIRGMWNSLVSNKDALQTLAALANAAFAFALVIITGLYTLFTYRLLRHTQEDSGREWLPELHVRLRLDGDKVNAEMTNLGRTAILADKLTTQPGGTDAITHGIDTPVIAGGSATIDISAMLRSCKHGKPGIVPEGTPGRTTVMSMTEGQIVVAVWVSFYAQGRYHHAESSLIAISPDPNRLVPGLISSRFNWEIRGIQYAWWQKPRLWWWYVMRRIRRR
jgi:hypothetical protein